jgi:hypothetical protein
MKTSTYKQWVVRVFAITLVAASTCRANGEKPDPKVMAALESIVARVEKIKPGILLSEVMVDFEHDGGIYTLKEMRLCYKAYPYIKIDVVISPSKDKPGDQRIESVSKPYIETPFLD